MSIANLYKLSVVVTPAGQIHQLIDRSIDPGIQELVIKGDGKISPQYYANMEQRPSARFSTTAVHAALTALGSGFYPFSSAVDLYLGQLAAGGGISAGSAHRRITGTKGCIVPRRLRARHNAPAVLEAEVYFLSTDGVTAPISFSSAVALPTITLANQAFTLGPAKINGTALAAVEELDVEFGYAPLILGGDGEMYPTFGGYDARAPRVTVRTKDPAVLATVGVGGLLQSAVTPSVFYLRKMDPSTGRVANATVQHIKFTVSAGFHAPRPVEEDDERESVIELVSTPLDDGVNDILAVNLASAIA